LFFLPPLLHLTLPEFGSGAGACLKALQEARVESHAPEPEERKAIKHFTFPTEAESSTDFFRK
jgi:hypothetical protein